MFKKTILLFVLLLLIIFLSAITFAAMIIGMGGYKVFNSEIGFGFSVFFGLAVLSIIAYVPIFFLRKSGIYLTGVASGMVFLIPILKFLGAVNWNPVFESPRIVLLGISVSYLVHWQLFNLCTFFTKKL